jgi:hypothetical protein
VTEPFPVARYALYRWLHAAEGGDLGERPSRTDSPRQTPVDLARMLRGIFEPNPHFGHHRTANTLWLLGVLVAGSTVPNVLVRSGPRGTPVGTSARAVPAGPREVVARYPDHVWSVDRTRVLR